MFYFLETEALCAALSQKGQKYAGYHQEYNRENTLPNLEETCGASATIRAQGTLSYSGHASSRGAGWN